MPSSLPYLPPATNPHITYVAAMTPVVETADARIAFMAAHAGLRYKLNTHTHPERASKSKPKPYDRPESSQHALRRMQESKLLRDVSAGGRVGRTIYNHRASAQIKTEELAEVARIVEQQEEWDGAGELYLAERSAHVGAVKIKTEWLEPTLAGLTQPRTPEKRSDALALATPQLSPAGSSRLSSPASSILSTPGPSLSLFDRDDEVLPSPPEPVTVVKVEDEIAQDAARLFAQLYTNEDCVFI